MILYSVLQSVSVLLIMAEGLSEGKADITTEEFEKLMKSMRTAGGLKSSNMIHMSPK